MLHRFPSHLLCQLSRDWLYDRDTNAVAICCKQSLQALAKYESKKVWRPSDCSSAPSNDIGNPNLRFGLVARLEVDNASARMLPIWCEQQQQCRIRALFFSTDWTASMDSVLNIPCFQYLTCLQMDEAQGAFNEPLPVAQLPSTLLELQMSARFNHPLPTDVWPCSLTQLRLGVDFEQPLINLPISLQHLTLSTKWNLPPSRETLRLPETLLSLTFGDGFSQPVDGLQLPNRLTNLSFGLQDYFGKFNQSIRGLQIPASLTRLHFPKCFATIDEPKLPDLRFHTNLTVLHLGEMWKAPLRFLQLPPWIREFRFPTHLGSSSWDGLVLPEGLQVLSLPGLTPLPPGDLWPAGLREIHLGFITAGPREWQFSSLALTSVQFPTSLETLHLWNGFNGPIVAGCLPSTLRYLELGGLWNRPLTDLVLPSALHTICFGDNFDQSLAGYVWPTSLRVLRFRLQFNQPLTTLSWCPPPALEELSFLNHSCWNQPAELFLPDTLRLLRFGRALEIRTAMRLPPRLQVLSFCTRFNLPVDELQLPPSLTELHIAWSERDYSQSRFGIFNQPLNRLRLPDTLRILAVRSTLFVQSLVHLPTLPSSLKQLQLVDVHTWRASPWNQIRLPTDCALIFLNEQTPPVPETI